MSNLKTAVVELLLAHSNLAEHGDSVVEAVAQECATILGRSQAAKYGIKLSATSKGVALTEGTGFKGLPATPAMRLIAACSQLEQVVSKLTNAKGAYLMSDVATCITVSPAWVKALDVPVAGPVPQSA